MLTARLVLSADVVFCEKLIKLTDNPTWTNVTSTDDTILTAGTNSIPGWDMKYSPDDLNRMVQADEGELSGGSITNRAG